MRAGATTTRRTCVRRSAGSRAPLGRLEVTLTSIVVVVLVAGVPAGARGAASHHPGSTPAVPPTARLLAQRLGIRGQPVVGNQPEGRGRPWVAWFPRTIEPAWVGPGNVPRRYLEMAGPALFTGPRGADGEFHYLNSAPLSPTGAGRYRGPKLGRARALSIARAWLRRAGVSAPRDPLHVQLRSGTTVLGGTGLCCSTVLDVVYWGGSTNGYGFVQHASAMIYIADAGTVVQADIGALPGDGSGGSPFSQPCPGRTQRDRNGVALGPWCFDYAAAVRALLVADVGDHGPWKDDPDQMAGAPINNTRACRPVHRLSLTARQAVYVQSCRGVSYRVVLVPIFPGLVGSTWELARVASSPGRSSAAGSVPPAAQRLAGHLRLIGRPSVGNLPRGNAGPWTIWAQPSVDRASRILSTGPLGARGQFDYFDIAAEPGREGRIRDEPCHRRRRLVRPAGGSGRLGRLFPGPASG